MVRVAINGFGRIGRMVYRVGLNYPEIDFVAINDLASPEQLAYLLKYDSAHGKFNGTVDFNDHALIVNGKELKVLSERDPAQLPWGDLNIDVVIESTGIFRHREQMELHLKAGAKKVLLSAPPKGEEKVRVFVMGVNDDKIGPEDNLISNASCTTNSLAPVAKILNDAFGIDKAFMSTVHSYTSDQRLVDAPHKDFRRGRSAAANIIPTTTGAAIAVTEVIPELKGRMNGLAFRVPTVDGSITDFNAVLKRSVTKDELLNALKEAINGKFKGIVDLTTEPLVSKDIVGNSNSSIIDWDHCMVIDNMVKIVTWYDNEWGYSNRMIDLVKKLANFI
ncbi:MAG: type I glyceraldehyde-3-phosphate dehydrogenase [Nitrospiraceae bacterium]|nr:type I glyceraldehyde-3-phosphate dehydrogenase [Nitrospiraceae bacterium]